METRIIKACGDPELDRELMIEAGQIIRSGGLVAIPTETVYGLAGDALNPDSSEKIYSAKGRPSDNPLIVHISDMDDLYKVAGTVPEKAEILAGRFWPGPLTMVFKKTSIVPKETTGGLDTVAVRMPVNPIAAEFITAAGGFIAAPSANRSGRPSCTRAEHVYEDMRGRIPLIIDGGEVGIGLESTIVDMTGDRPCLLRPGYINEEMLREAVGEIDIDPAVNGVTEADSHPRAPGMKYRHYAPEGELIIVRGDRDRVISEINRRIAEDKLKGKKTAVIATDETVRSYTADLAESLGERADEDSIAHNLFNVLRKMDEAGADCIYSEEFDTPRIGSAIMNRLIRAAGHRVIDV